MQRIPDAEVTPEEGPDAQNVGYGMAWMGGGMDGYGWVYDLRPKDPVPDAFVKCWKPNM